MDRIQADITKMHGHPPTVDGIVGKFRPNRKAESRDDSRTRSMNAAPTGFVVSCVVIPTRFVA